MEVFLLAGKCPKCSVGMLRRIHRHAWMRLIPGSRFYQCDFCYYRFFQICGHKMVFSD